MARIVASAPGKIILFGEHFVVRGAPSIATAVCRRVYVSVEDSGDGRFYLESDRLGLRISMSPEDALSAGGPLAPLAGLLRWFRERYGVEPGPVSVRVRSEIPVGAGLGSSAAFSAAFALAYAGYHGMRLLLEDLEEASMAAERIAHGNPSGVDTVIAVRGGSVLYRRGSEPRPLSLRLPRDTVLVVADTGVPRSTRRVVEHVLARARLAGPAGDALYRVAESIVGQALEAFENGDARRLGALMDLNHGLLYALGASSLELERVVYAARRAGAYGAKLTGAGWGGAAIALSPEDRIERVLGAVIGAGAREAFSTDLGCEGARIEE